MSHDPLNNVEIERYSRQLIIPEFNLDGEARRRKRKSVFFSFLIIVILVFILK